MSELPIKRMHVYVEGELSEDTQDGQFKIERSGAHDHQSSVPNADVPDEVKERVQPGYGPMQR